MTATEPLEKPVEASILETSQQFLLGEHAPADVVYKLGRACTAHCLAAAQELMGVTPDNATDNLVDFVLQYGAETGSGLYHDGKGWDISSLSDLMRLNGFSMISQNLRYGSGESDVQQAAKTGRVRTEAEKSHLVLRSDYGGTSRERWPESISHTLDLGGMVMTSIQIPLLSGDGYGMHAVLVTGLDEAAGEVTYFDPDFYNLSRYGSAPPTIERVDETRLIYRRPIVEHLSYMTGEITHILPRTSAE